MVRRNVVLVPVLAFFLGGLAVAFSFIAYAKRIKDVGPKINGSCVYPSSPAYALGIVAALFLLAEQIVISAGTYCFCCCGSRCSARCTLITSILFFIVSWLAFLIAFIGLIYTSIFNYNTFLAKNYPGNDGGSCKLEKENLFLGTAIWCIISTGLGLIAYAFWACGAASERNNNRDRGIAMGEPNVQVQQSKEQC